MLAPGPGEKVGMAAPGSNFPTTTAHGCSRRLAPAPPMVQGHEKGVNTRTRGRKADLPWRGWKFDRREPTDIAIAGDARPQQQRRRVERPCRGHHNGRCEHEAQGGTSRLPSRDHHANSLALALRSTGLTFVFGCLCALVCENLLGVRGGNDPGAVGARVC